MKSKSNGGEVSGKFFMRGIWVYKKVATGVIAIKENRFVQKLNDERGDVPGWVLVVLMTTGLVTAIWTIAAPRLSAILKNSLDAMNGIR